MYEGGVMLIIIKFSFRFQNYEDFVYAFRKSKYKNWKLESNNVNFRRDLQNTVYVALKNKRVSE